MNTTMNTVNQTFNWSRFTATLRKEIIENKRAIIITVLCIYGLLTVLMVFGNFTTGVTDSIQDSLDKRIPQLFVAAILTFVVTVSASLTFKNLTTKAGRTSLLTSPSSTLEKFLSNILIYILGLIVVYMVCAQLADLTRIAILWFFRSETFSVPGPINFLDSFSGAQDYYQLLYGPVADYFGNISLAMFLSVLTNAGLYLLGSVVWPRLSFLKTLLATYAFQFVLFLISIIIFTVSGDPVNIMFKIAEFFQEGKFTIFSYVLTIGVLILNYGLAWFLFKRKDVVSLKWWK